LQELFAGDRIPNADGVVITAGHNPVGTYGNVIHVAPVSFLIEVEVLAGGEVHHAHAAPAEAGQQLGVGRDAQPAAAVLHPLEVFPVDRIPVVEGTVG